MIGAFILGAFFPLAAIAFARLQPRTPGQREIDALARRDRRR